MLNYACFVALNEMNTCIILMRSFVIYMYIDASPDDLDEAAVGPDTGVWSSVAALLISLPALVGS